MINKIVSFEYSINDFNENKSINQVISDISMLIQSNQLPNVSNLGMLTNEKNIINSNTE